MESARDARPLRILDHGGFLSRQLHDGKQISGIFRCPYFKTTCFKMDWLHVLDLGCSQDVLGILANYAVFGAQSGRAGGRAAVGDEEFLPGKHHREADRDHDSEAVLQQPQTEQSSGRIESSHPVCPPDGGEVLRIHGTSQAATTG